MAIYYQVLTHKVFTHIALLSELYSVYSTVQRRLVYSKNKQFCAMKIRKMLMLMHTLNDH